MEVDCQTQNHCFRPAVLLFHFFVADIFSTVHSIIITHSWKQYIKNMHYYLESDLIWHGRKTIHCLAYRVEVIANNTALTVIFNVT